MPATPLVAPAAQSGNPIASLDGRSHNFVGLFSLLLFLGLNMNHPDAARAASTCPTSGNNITIASACTLEGGSYSYTGTLTISATITAASDVGATPVVIQADNITVNSSGGINANNRGYVAATGPGYTSAPVSGAGHGGLGGSASGAAYGSVSGPVTFGSGGAGAAGGGAIVLRAPSGTITILGTVQANGQSNTGTCNNDGGAGGSVWLEAATLGGTGSVLARGGTSCNNRQGGGGGRIALKYTTLAAGATVVNNASASSSGGSGGAGTVYVESGSAGALTYSIIIDNANSATGSFTPQVASESYHAMTIRNGARYRVNSGANLTLLSGGTLTGGGAQAPLLEILDGGSFTTNSAVSISSLNLGVYGSVNSPSMTLSTSYFTMGGVFHPSFGTLAIGNGATLAQQGLSTLSLSTLIVSSGGTVNHRDNSTERAHVVDIAANTIDIQAGGSVNVNALGFDAGNGPGASTGPSSSASYGGLGSGAAAGTAYGDLFVPTDLGSGGRGTGSGGGAIKLTASGTLTVNGTVSANGAVTAAANNGAGSGGSVILQAGTLAGSGSVTANGTGFSSGGTTTSSGGGRIAIFFSSNTSSLVSTAGKLQAYGGSTNPSGGAGTIYVKPAGTTGDLIVDGNNHVGLGFTPCLSPTVNPQVFRNITIRNGGRLRIADGNSVQLDTGGGLQASGATRPSLTIDVGGQFVVPAGAFAVSGLDVTLDGTWRDTTILSLTNSTFTHEGTFSPPLQGLNVDTGAIFIQNVGGTFTVPAIAVKNTGIYRVGSGSILELSAGVLSGSGAAPVMEVLAGGTLRGASSLTLSGLTFNIDGVLSGADITLGAVMNMTGAFADNFGIFRVANGGVFEQRTSTQLAVSTLDIQAGGTYQSGANPTPPAGYAANWKQYQVNIKATDMTIAGAVSATGRGFPAAQGPGYAGALASHAGYAGGNGGAAPYGAVVDSQFLGSGSHAFAGGGAIRLEAINLNLTGTVSADGVGTSYYAQQHGSAGGSVLIESSVFAGNGIISAVGGDGGVHYNYRGGGGGRVTLRYASLAPDADPYASGRVRAWGGNGGFIAGAGTVYIAKISQPLNDDLIIDNRLTGGAGSDTPQIGAREEYQRVTLKGGARYILPAGKTLVIAESLLGSATGVRSYFNLSAGGRLEPPSSTTTISNIDFDHVGVLAITKILTIDNALYYWTGEFEAGLDSLTLGLNGVFIQQNSTLLELDSLDVQRDGQIQSGINPAPPAGYASDWKQFMVNIKATDMTVAGLVTANGRGFPAAQGPGYSGSLASHAGRAGGNGGGAPYGTAVDSLTMGSGSHAFGGGGAIRLEATNLNLTGTVSADGIGTSYFAQQHGAAGGSVLVKTSVFDGAGTISAVGGDGGVHYGYRGGGGGRVTLRYDTLGAAADPFAANRVRAWGGNGGFVAGAGTVYLERTSEPATNDLIIDNRLTAGSSADTPQLGANETYDRVAFRGGARYNIGSGKTLEVLESFSGSATGARPDLVLSAGGRLEPPSSTTTISHLDVEHVGVLAKTTQLSIDNSNYFWSGTFESPLGSLVLGSGCVFEQQTTSQLVADSFEIQSGGILQAAVNPDPPSGYATDWKQYMVNVRATDLVISGLVTVSGRGFPAARGPGYAGALASHAGRAGGNAGGPCYGTAADSLTMGSGSHVHPGGGAIRLEARSLRLSGTLNADGLGTSYYGQQHGAAGGSVVVVTSLLEGVGTISAVGGEGGTHYGYRGGGGGRITLRYDSLGSDFDPFSNNRVRAFGGLGGFPGGAGTVYLAKSSDPGVSDLILDNRLTSGSGAETQLADTSFSFDRLTLRGGGQMRLLSGANVALSRAAGRVVSSGAPRPAIFVDSGSNFGLPETVTLSAFDMTVLGRLSQVAKLTLTDISLNYQPDSVNVFSSLTVGNGATLQFSGTKLFPVTNLNVANGGVITHAVGGSSQAHFVNISASSVNVASGGQIHANARGYTSAVAGTGGGTGGAAGSGGGHGGAGGASSSAAAGGAAVGVAATPKLYGGVGGADTDQGTVAGGAGGGYIKLSVCGGLVVDGSISANGGNGSAQQAGGGAGGSIFITTSQLSGSGTITANGGNGLGGGANTAGAGGGGGGGGRIAVYSDANIFPQAQILVSGGGRGSTSAIVGGLGTRVFGAQADSDVTCPPGGCGSGVCAGVWRPDLMACEYTSFSANDTCTVGTGACVNTGKLVCNADGTTGCSAAPIEPSAEVCDAVDNNCDGATDEGFSVGTLCSVGTGACANTGPILCQADGTSACSAIPRASSSEKCDTLDNDCDGTTDEDFPLGEGCTVGTGACVATGVMVCKANGTAACGATPGVAKTESCDGVDNDCDGLTDEGFSVGATCEVGVGACTNAGLIECKADGKAGCNVAPKAPGTETCDAIDNDCDGTTDEGFSLGVRCEVGVGACLNAGVIACQSDGNSKCNVEPKSPSMEVCDALDNNCDGTTDEGFALGTACEVGVGACVNAGLIECKSDGSAGCDVEPKSANAEVCDGVDNNCDGQSDEGFSLGDSCRVGVGECVNAGEITCRADGTSGCNVEPKTPSAEVCDTLDNNCDGAVDEGFSLGDACEVGVGECVNQGAIECKGDGTSGCNVEPKSPAAEVCDAVDNDCDGTTDEGFSLGVACEVGVGACLNAGVIACKADGSAACNVEPKPPGVEVCDAKDNDCDGETDEGFLLGDACEVGLGTCLNGGVIACKADGSAACNVEPKPPGVEICDAKDNDCDGEIDEGFSLGDVCEVGVGGCANKGFIECQSDGSSGCDVEPRVPQAEACDEVDNDCDGETDEGLSLRDKCVVGNESPLVEPLIPPIVVSDGASFVLDLTEYENDFEDGPGADGNLLTWSIDFDPGLLEVDLNAMTDIVELRPVSADFPFSVELEFTLTDSEGATETVLVEYTHKVSDYVLTVEASPNPALPDGARVVVKATLKSPAGRALARRAIRFSMPEGDGILLARNALTDAEGVAKTVVLTGTAFTPHLLRAQHTGIFATYVGETTLEVKPHPHDAGINVLDIGFQDVETGEPIIPGDVNPLPAFTPVEILANVRNLGLESTPPLDVLLRHSVVSFDPPGLGDFEPLGTLRTQPIIFAASDVVSLEEAFGVEGFHILEAIVDPDNAFIEGDEANNRASQGFWVGDFEGGVDPGLAGIITSCELEGGSVAPSGDIGVEPGDLLELQGRADYPALRPFDPDGSRGLAAVRGGIVTLEILDDAGESVTVGTAPNILVPASGRERRFSALKTLASAENAADIGHFPNRAPDDIWDLATPSEFGCYTLRTCVTDGSAEGCCEKRFCVVPEGPQLTCELPTTPLDGELPESPVIGEETSLATLVTNEGDYPAVDISARLLVDGVQVGMPVPIAALDPEAMGSVELPWTPGCGARSAVIELSWKSPFEGDDKVRTSTCRSPMPDVIASELAVATVDRCDMDLIVKKTLTQVAGIPASETAALFTIEKPDGSSETRKGTTGLRTSTHSTFRFDMPGTYTMAALVDGPVVPETLCGEAPEIDERTNNVITREFCADPSPSDDADGGSTEALVIEPWPVVYGEPATVRAKLFNHGALPMNVPIDVLLTSSRGPILDTDQPGDINRVEASCDLPLMPGESRDLTWVWTPRYPSNGQPELRDLRVSTNLEGVFEVCDEASMNDTIELKYDMNLKPKMTTAQVMQLDKRLDFQVDVLHSGGIRPNDEGSLVRFEVFKDGGARLHRDDERIVAPGPESPDRHDFDWTPSVADCDTNLPLLHVRAEVDQNRVYVESNEGDNVGTLALPDLVPAKLEEKAEGCESRIILTIEDRAEAPSIPAGIWNGIISITGPDGGVTEVALENMSGAGEFDITELTDVRFPSSVAGTYRYAVQIDTSDASDCGDILESNERNNRLEGAWTLCPDPAFTGTALVPVGLVQRGRETEFVATLKNLGRLAIQRDVPVRLGTYAGLLQNLAEPIAYLEASCDSPIDPNGTYEVSWNVDLSPLDPVDVLVATIDPADVMPEECLATNNRTQRFLYLDISPWTSWQSPNFATIRDIASESRPQWGAVADASYVVRTHGPRPGAANARGERLGGVIQVYPGVDETIDDQVFVRASGTREVFEEIPLDAAAEDYPVVMDVSVPFLQDHCKPEDPIVSVEVRVDPPNRVLESLEVNQKTTRALPNLRVTNITRSPVLNDRFKLTYSAGSANFKEFYIGHWEASGELVRPDGTVEPITLAPQDGPYSRCQGCQAEGSAAEPIAHPLGIDVAENGIYKLKITVDPPREDALCGDIPERDESDNTKEVSWPLCPNLSVVVEASPPVDDEGKRLPSGPWEVKVTVTNNGTRSLIEDIEVRVLGLDANGLPVFADITPDFRTKGFSRATPLDVGRSATFDFMWEPSTPGPEIARIGAEVEVFDTDPDNGVFPETALCSMSDDGSQRDGSTPVCLDCGLDGGDGSGERGCRIDVAESPLLACGEASISFSASRPGSGAAIGPGLVDTLVTDLQVIDAEGFIDPMSLDFIPGGAGEWTSEFELPASMLGASMSLFVRMQLTDGSLCFGQQSFLVEGGAAGISVSNDNIEFTSLNGDGVAYSQASVGDIAEMRLSVSNDEESCGALDLTGRAYIELGYDQIKLGRWHISSIDSGETKSVELIPHPNQPHVPEIQDDGSFLWTVTAPSPWVHIVTLVVDVLDGEPLIATRALFVGRFPGGGDDESSELVVTLVDPTPGPLTRQTDEAFTFQVERSLENGDLEAVLPEELAQLDAIVTAPDGTALANFDMLADEDDDLGGGEFVAHFDTSRLPVNFTVTARARLVEGLTGFGSGDFTLEDDCGTGDPRPGDTGYICVECVDLDGDGHFGFTETCLDGTDCDDEDMKGTTVDVDGDCDGSRTEEDCDDNDPEIVGPCPYDCETSPGIDVVLGSVTAKARDCAEDRPSIEVQMTNLGTMAVGPELSLSLFTVEPGLGVRPALAVELADLTLVEGELPLLPGASLTASYEAPAGLAGLLGAEFWVIANHAADTPFSVFDGMITTSGVVAECNLEDNLVGPVSCESTGVERECEVDADCGLAEDRCDVRICADGMCVDSDDGTTWSLCEAREVFYVRVKRGEEAGYVACRPTPEGRAECDRDEDGLPLIVPVPRDLICVP